MNEDLINRITYHLSSGGLFNPELADHLAVRNLLMECREALAQPEQEPVAWMHTKLDGVVVPHRPADLDRHPDRWEALYKNTQPCPTCEALARTVMLDQTSHDTAPPQRKPLTEKEIEKCYETLGHYQTLRPQDRFAVFALARAIEAAHNIKE